MQGRLWAENTLELGAKFSISLPIAEVVLPQQIQELK
ncbi:hypothetical protein ACLKMH_18525 [Psychromonas sp. KJ10-10]